MVQSSLRAATLPLPRPSTALLFASLVFAGAALPPAAFCATLPGANEIEAAPDPASMDVARDLAAPKASAWARSSARARAATANQQAYDVRFYDLDLNIEPPTHMLRGTVRIRATVVAGPLSSLDLDFESGGMSVDSVKISGAPTANAHVNDVLSIPLDRAYTTGETVEVTVAFQGTPLPGNYFGPFVFTQQLGQPAVWTLSEPFSARAWWPCKDQPDDKADSVDIRVTMPTGMKTASNGKRVQNTDDGVHAVTRWTVRYPIATYLISIASYPYVTSTDWYVHAPGDSMEIQFYLYPDDVSWASTVHPQVKTMLGVFAGRFGPYPFLREKYGHADVTLNGGMEHQTCTSIGRFDEWTVCHEAAHQWWGDMVTCRDFHHVWLNEGFATYAEALWAEAKYGVASYRQDLSLNKYFGPGTVHVPTLDQPNRIFDFELSYRKGSWVLHMLRHVLGDAAFFTALQTYGQRFKYGSATTEDLQDVCEEVSGRSLQKFFQQWIYGEFAPAYAFSYTVTPAGGGYDVMARIRQMQSYQLFRMPIDVRVTTAGGAQTFVVEDSLADQEFTLHVAEQPTDVTMDPDEWILRTMGTAEVPVAGGASIDLSARPNPASNGADVVFTLPRPGLTRVSLVDVGGRTILELQRGELSAGPHRLHWFGRDADGKAVPGGVYWLRVEQGDKRRTVRLAVVR